LLRSKLRNIITQINGTEAVLAFISNNEIINLQNGDFIAESKGNDKGTRFII